MPVQWVNLPDLDFRGFSGAIVGGALRPGDRVRVLEGCGLSIVSADSRRSVVRQWWQSAG